ncbi:hypothetical protein IH824_13460 [candidate division KSB1 bacterium]|nr:hypothetical protein [candidate division KSB1 bacterium]MCH8873755.1 hypothetical protein [candidate division KSB1 bacterium]
MPQFNKRNAAYHQISPPGRRVYRGAEFWVLMSASGNTGSTSIAGFHENRVAAYRYTHASAEAGKPLVGPPKYIPIFFMVTSPALGGLDSTYLPCLKNAG